MYADKITPSMERAIEETNRRREKQVAYNTDNGTRIRPRCAAIADITRTCCPARPRTLRICSLDPVGGSGRSQSRGKSAVSRPQRAGRVGWVVGVGSHAGGGLDVAEMPRAQLPTSSAAQRPDVETPREN